MYNWLLAVVCFLKIYIFPKIILVEQSMTYSWSSPPNLATFGWKLLLHYQGLQNFNFSIPFSGNWKTHLHFNKKNCLYQISVSSWCILSKTCSCKCCSHNLTFPTVWCPVTSVNSSCKCFYDPFAFVFLCLSSYTFEAIVAWKTQFGNSCCVL